MKVKAQIAVLDKIDSQGHLIPKNVTFSYENPIGVYEDFDIASVPIGESEKIYVEDSKLMADIEIYDDMLIKVNPENTIFSFSFLIHGYEKISLTSQDEYDYIMIKNMEILSLGIIPKSQSVYKEQNG